MIRNNKKLIVLSLLILHLPPISAKNWIADENGVTPTFYLVCVLIVIVFLVGIVTFTFISKKYYEKNGGVDDFNLSGCGVIAFLLFSGLMLMGIAGQCAN